MRRSLLAFALLLTGCIKEIPVEQQPYTSKPAIESLLQPGEIPKVYLNRTVPFFEPTQTPSSLFLRDAQVVIEGPDGADFLRADSTYDGFYCRYVPYYIGAEEIRPDAQYKLRVAVDGEVLTAETTTNVPAATIDSVTYVTQFTDIYGGHEGVVVFFDDLVGGSNQYRFLMERPLNNEHETVDDREYRSACLADGEEALVHEIGRSIYFDRHLDGAPVKFVIEPAYTNVKGDPATVYVQSLGPAAADFYDTLDRQREANVNPFVEPVFLHSNIEGALGVFGAANLSAPYHFVFPLTSE